MNTAESFSSWFRHQLDRREWRQADFAREAKLNPTTVSAWYRGVRLPDPDSCETIADVLHADLDMVLVFAGHRPNPDEDVAPDDPRVDLIALVRRVRWNAERESIAKAVFEAMVRADKGAR